MPAVVGEVDIPYAAVSAPTFGGSNGDILFVNTANLQFNPYTLTIDAPDRVPPAGDLFLVRGLDAPGAPSYRARI